MRIGSPSRIYGSKRADICLQVVRKAPLLLKSYVLCYSQKNCLFIPCGILWFSSVQFSRSIVSDSLRPHESQHARPPCPLPTHQHEFTQTHVHRVSNVIQPSHPLSSSVLPPIPPSIRVFSNDRTEHLPTKNSLKTSIETSISSQGPKSH